MDTRIEDGLGAHAQRFAASLEAGATRLGWKVAFNAPAVQQALRLPYSLVAGLTRATLVDAGEPLSLSGMTRPALEAEVAVWLGADIGPTTPRHAAAAAVARWAPAIELVDFDRPLDQLESILAEGVFHRAVVLGDPVDAEPGAQLRGKAVKVQHGDALLCEVDAGEATGDAAEVLLHLASLLAPHGLSLHTGDVVILGSMNPPCLAEADKTFTVEIEGLGRLALALQ